MEIGIIEIIEIIPPWHGNKDFLNYWHYSIPGMEIMTVEIIEIIPPKFELAWKLIVWNMDNMVFRSSLRTPMNWQFEHIDHHFDCNRN